MIKRTNTCQAKLIAPILINYYEKEKNKSPTSETKISYKQIHKPKPLNIRSLTELNNKTTFDNNDLTQFYGNPNLYKSNYINHK